MLDMLLASSRDEGSGGGGVQVRRTSVKGAIEGVAAFKDSSLAVIVCDKRADKAPRPGNNHNPRLVEDVDAL